MMFEAIEYIVHSIDGDYAHLSRVDNPDEELKLVARALLPDMIREGSRLQYEMLQYNNMFDLKAQSDLFFPYLTE